MTLNNTNIKNRGFTIVELLIVIVVIGILAAITIVAYNGVQNRAKTSAAQSLADTVKKKAEAFHAIGDANAYPADATKLKSSASPVPPDEAVITDGDAAKIDTDPPSSTTPVQYKACGTDGAMTDYYDFSSTSTHHITYLGEGSATTCA